MSQGSVFLGWIAAGAGVTLAYAAYRNKSPLGLLSDTLRGTATGAAFTSGDTDTNTSNAGDNRGTDPTATDRASKLAARTVSPTWVPIPSQPTQMLDVIAVPSFMAVQAEYGRPIILSGSRRSYDQQAGAYANDPAHFAPPGHSLHEVGLAVDVSSTFTDLNDPRLLAAFTHHGWYRRGKVLSNGQPEPWHYSFGVPG